MLSHQLLNVQITTYVEISFKIANEFIMQVAFFKKICSINRTIL